MAFTLSKAERLCRTSHISKLFEKGNPKVNGFPFRFSWVYIDHDGPFPVQVLFVVPKRTFARANRRNRIKRQLRELYRLNKQGMYDLLSEQGKKIILSVSFTAPAELPLVHLEPAYLKILEKVNHELAKNH